MAQHLKVFRIHLGFHDAVIAVPSKKAALAAWGVGASQFSQGFASQTNDPDAVAAAMEQPGVVLRRPFGSGGAFKIQADTPTLPPLSQAQKIAREKARQDQKKKAEAKAAAEKKREKKALAEELAAIEEEIQLRERRSAVRRKIKRKAA